jgi:hypothetical protein
MDSVVLSKLEYHATTPNRVPCPDHTLSASDVWADPDLASSAVVLRPSGKGFCQAGRRNGLTLPAGRGIDTGVAGTCYPIGMAHPSD